MRARVITTSSFRAHAKTSSTGPGLGIAIAILAVLVLHTIDGWIRRIAMPTTWDYGPAQLATSVDLFVRGAPLYRDFRSAPFMPLVYGPVVPALTMVLAPIFGGGPMAALEAGRVLTIASTLLAAAMVFLLARRTGACRAAAILATLAFILSPIVLRWGFEYRVDMPVLACELSGIFAFASGATATALALFAISFFVKQAHAVGIATVVLFCWISGQRRRATILALIYLGLIGAGTVLLAAAYPFYLQNTFGAVRTMNFDLSAPILFVAILIGGNVGLALFGVIALTRRRMTDRLIVCLLIVASMHDLASCLRWGSNAYYFLPALAALTIVASAGIDLALERMRSMGVTAQVVAGSAIAALLALGFMLAPRAITTVIATDPWDHRALDALRSIQGHILTDVAELKLVDNRDNLQWIDLMVLTSMEQLGTFNDQALLETIRQHQIAAFALDEEGLGRSFRGRPLFWPRLREAIEANYQVEPLMGPPYLMIPKKAR